MLAGKPVKIIFDQVSMMPARSSAVTEFIIAVELN
jgi:hypothetical protein